MLNCLFIVYVLVFLFMLIRMLRTTGIYVFAPLITIYLPFITDDIYPLIVFDDEIPKSLIWVTSVSCIINLIFLVIFRNQWTKKVTVEPQQQLDAPKIRHTRERVLTVFITMIVLAGFVSGLTPALLSGQNVEDLRMTSDIGMGFLRAIPALGIPYLILEFYFQNKAITVIKAGVIGLALGSLMFITTAARGGLLAYFMVFIIWFNIKHRGLKWYEYFGIFYFLKPVVASVLVIIRGAGTLSLCSFVLLEHQLMIFKSNTIKLASYLDQYKDFLWGESYYYSLVRIIPRFIWSEKPISIDYRYKKMVGYDFDGGGIYTTPGFDFYINFAEYYIIPYVFWLLLIHYLYNKLITGYLKFDASLFVLLALTLFFKLGAMIERVEIYALILIIFFMLNKRWRII